MIFVRKHAPNSSTGASLQTSVPLCPPRAGTSVFSRVKRSKQVANVSLVTPSAPQKFSAEAAGGSCQCALPVTLSTHFAAVLAGVAFCLAVLILCAAPAAAWADLTVYVGYAGGPYYEKATFTDAELEQMADSTVYEYTSFDAANYLRKGFAQGVKLESIFLKAGVDPWSLWRFFFGTTDSYITDDGGYGTNGEAWYYSTLAGSTRYYYPDYLEYANFENGRAQVDSEFYSALQSTAVAVPTILALRSSFQRVTETDSAAWVSQTLSTSAGLRLMFGESSPCTGGARDIAQQVRSITCILGGSNGTDLPTVDFGDLDMSGAAVGDTFTFTPSIVGAQDELIAQLGPADINWKVVDASTGADVTGVLDVTKNADGTVTIKVLSAGNVRLVASFGNSDYTEFVSSASQGFSGGKGDDGTGGGGTGAGTNNDGEGGASVGAVDGNQDDGGGSSTGGEGEQTEPVALEAGTQMQQVEVGAAAPAATSATESSLKVITDAAGGTGADGLAIYQLMAGQSDMDVTVHDTPVAIFWLLAALLVLGFLRRLVLFELAKDKRVKNSSPKGEKCLV
jgi:hypothetical protein